MHVAIDALTEYMQGRRYGEAKTYRSARRLPYVLFTRLDVIKHIRDYVIHKKISM